jgi:hypothetical protein
MNITVKNSKLLSLVMLFGVLFTTLGVSAQTPDDDPGIGGPGSGNNTPGDDGGPIVPLDQDLSIALIAVGLAYGYKKIKQSSLVVRD